MRTLRRLSMALALSLSVLGGSFYFAKQFESATVSDSSQKPVAFAKQINDEVERRPVTSLVWNLLDAGEPLYPGEAIKTSEKGEVRIQFAESSRFIDLDPDSLIVISQGSKNEISLDLQGGSLFVSQGDNKTAGANSNEPALTLNSENGKVDLSQATAQLSKSEGKAIDVQVLKGKAKVESNGQSKEIDSSHKLSNVEIVLPSLDKPFFVNPENPQPVVFRWKGLPPNSSVTLASGKTRKDLKPLNTGDIAENTFSAKFTTGKYFWKLVAKDKATGSVLQESSVYRLEVASRYAPSPLFPADEAQILKEKADSTVDFKWNKPDAVKSVYVEVAKDASMKDKVFSQNILDQDVLKKSLPEGTYFWRLSGTYEGIEKPIVSKTRQFTVTAQIKPKEPPKPPVAISWTSPMDDKPQFFIDDPIASLAWNSEQKNQVKTWRLKVAPTEADFATPGNLAVVTQETTDLNTKAVLKKPGRYIAMVEALDEKKQVLAKSNFKSIEVAPMPLLNSPEFQPSLGELKADNQGKLDLKWNKVDGAKEYWLTLFDSSGKEMRKAKFQGSSTSLVNLLPGKYKVSIHAVDTHGRESEKSEARTVVVPDSSGLQAPKVKKIKVN